MQLLQADVALLRKQLEAVQGAETTSVASARIIAHITKGEGADDFVLKEGAVSEHNAFHTTGPAAEDGCCVVL